MSGVECQVRKVGIADGIGMVRLAVVELDSPGQMILTRHAAPIGLRYAPEIQITGVMLQIHIRVLTI